LLSPLAYDVFLQIRTGNTTDTIRYVEENEWNIDGHLNTFKWTALHLAAFQGDSDLVEYLLRRGANPNLVNSTGFTPLMLAEYKGNSHLKRIFESKDLLVTNLAEASSA